MSRKTKLEFYSNKDIKKTGCTLGVVYGGRGNGKTYSFLYDAVEDYIKKGHQTVYLRRSREDIKPSLGTDQHIDGLIYNNVFSKLSKGKWTGCVYKNRAFYLTSYDDEKDAVIKDETPFCLVWTISQSQSYKGADRPDVYTIIFDEFIAEMEEAYLVGEWKKFKSIISTLKRHKDPKEFKIWLIGNPNDGYCPYFGNLRIKKLGEQKQGTIEVYKNGEGDMGIIAVEYCAKMEDKENKEFYEILGDADVNMILNGGIEQSQDYPQLPFDYSKDDINFTFFIDFDREKFQCELIDKEDNSILYIHKKTTELKYKDDDLVYSQNWDPRPNVRRNINKDNSNIANVIKYYFNNELVCYQDNHTGDMIKAYFKWCESE